MDLQGGVKSTLHAGKNSMRQGKILLQPQTNNKFFRLISAHNWSKLVFLRSQNFRAPAFLFLPLSLTQVVDSPTHFASL